MDRKPDGFNVCGSCLYHLAVRHCHDCDFDYCFSCHRHTRQSPHNFFQKAEMTKEQRSDEEFLTRLRCHKHKWGPVHSIKCDLCNSSKSTLLIYVFLHWTDSGTLNFFTVVHLNAAIRCEECKKHLCRPCHRRTHHHGSFSSHITVLI